MTRALEIVALLLSADDREAVLGDLEEQKQPGWLRLFALLGFVTRQQVEFWRGWCPWVVGSAVISATFLLLGSSFRLSLGFQDLISGASFREYLLYQAALVTAWAGTVGFVIGSLSWRTGWISPMLFSIPCISCLMEFREPSLSSLSLLLFVPPGIVGTILGLRWMRLGMAPSVILVCGTLSVMLLWRDMPTLNWLLLLPALYLAWASLKPNELEEGRIS